MDVDLDVTADIPKLKLYLYIKYNMPMNNCLSQISNPDIQGIAENSKNGTF